MSGECDLTLAERERYSRQLILPQIGPEGQMKLKRSRALIVGAGGLGSPAAMYLAASGVGELGIVDCDQVDLSNIQRQLLHASEDVGREKVDSARATLEEINPLIRVTPVNRRLTADNAAALIAGYDVVLGCLDNFTARYAVNAACVTLGIPNIYGSICMFEGQASVFAPGGPCYRCFFQDPPPDDWRPAPLERGILGAVPGIIGCIQATEAIKVILGIGQTLAGRLVLFDALRLRFRELSIKRDPQCPVCGTGSGRTV